MIFKNSTKYKNTIRYLCTMFYVNLNYTENSRAIKEHLIFGVAQAIFVHRFLNTCRLFGKFKLRMIQTNIVIQQSK